MIQLSPEQMAYVQDARIVSYIRRLRHGLTAQQVLEKVQARFGDQPSWGAGRIAELLEVRALVRAPKPPSPHLMKAADTEVKDFIRSFATTGEQGKTVREAVISRFGSERAPSLTTVGQLLAKARRAAGLPPKRARVGVKGTTSRKPRPKRR